MSQPAVTIGPSASLAEAARRLHAEGVKQLPVVDALGRLVGIVSRVDLLKAFLRSDEELYQEIVEDVIFGDLVMSPDRFDVDVKDGIVVLGGRCERRSLIPTVVRAVAAVDGMAPPTPPSRYSSVGELARCGGGCRRPGRSAGRRGP